MSCALGAISGCATPHGPSSTDLSRAAELRLGAPLHPTGDDAQLPPQVELGDGLDADEAVAVGLWRNPDLATELTELGIARADLVTAAQLPNPLLTVLLPVVDKKAEGVLSWPFDILWRRPRRIAVARHQADAVAARLLGRVLDLALAVRLDHADAVAANAAAAIARVAADLAAERLEVYAARLRVGDISERELSDVRLAQLRAGLTADLREREAELARLRLASRLGLDVAQVEPVGPSSTEPGLASDASTDGASATARRCDGAVDRALEGRPELAEARAGIARAGSEAGLARAEILNLTATLDANQTDGGAELGPGLSLALPVFDHQAGPRARAAAVLERAELGYLAVRHAVTADVQARCVEAQRAEAIAAALDGGVVVELERQLERTRNEFLSGQIAHLDVIDAQLRLVEGRRDLNDAIAEVRRSEARLDRAIGSTGTNGTNGNPGSGQAHDEP